MSIHSYNSGYNPYNGINNRFKKGNDVKKPDLVKEEKKMEVQQEPSTQNSTKTSDIDVEKLLANKGIEIVQADTIDQKPQYSDRTNDDPDVNGGQHNNGQNPPAGGTTGGTTGGNNDKGDKDGGNDDDGGSNGGSNGGHIYDERSFENDCKHSQPTQLENAAYHVSNGDESYGPILVVSGFISILKDLFD